MAKGFKDQLSNIEFDLNVVNQRCDGEGNSIRSEFQLLKGDLDLFSGDVDIESIFTDPDTSVCDWIDAGENLLPSMDGFTTPELPTLPSFDDFSLPTFDADMFSNMSGMLPFDIGGIDGDSLIEGAKGIGSDLSALVPELPGMPSIPGMPGVSDDLFGLKSIPNPFKESEDTPPEETVNLKNAMADDFKKSIDDTVKELSPSTTTLGSTVAIGGREFDLDLATMKKNADASVEKNRQTTAKDHISKKDSIFNSVEETLNKQMIDIKDSVAGAFKDNNILKEVVDKVNTKSVGSTCRSVAKAMDTFDALKDTFVKDMVNDVIRAMPTLDEFGGKVVAGVVKAISNKLDKGSDTYEKSRCELASKKIKEKTNAIKKEAESFGVDLDNEPKKTEKDRPELHVERNEINIIKMISSVDDDGGWFKDPRFFGTVVMEQKTYYTTAEPTSVYAIADVQFKDSTREKITYIINIVAPLRKGLPSDKSIAYKDLRRRWATEVRDDVYRVVEYEFFPNEYKLYEKLWIDGKVQKPTHIGGASWEMPYDN